MPCICIRGECGHDMLRERNVKCVMLKLKASSSSCRGGYVNATDKSSTGALSLSRATGPFPAVSVNS